MKRMILGLTALVLLSSPAASSAGGAFQLSTTKTDPSLSRVTLPLDTGAAYAVENVSYSSASQNFYFVLDGYEVADNQSACTNGMKFGIHADAAREGLIDQVKMAFLSGRKIKVHWEMGACTGGAPAPHYIKTYR